LTRLQKWSRVIDRQKSILIEENRAKTEVIRGKMRFVIQTLRDRESRYAGMAYNGMKGYRILVGD
jgi:tRNA A37 threonylcarbamoyltransferase TsaD